MGMTVIKDKANWIVNVVMQIYAPMTFMYIIQADIVYYFNVLRSKIHMVSSSLNCAKGFFAYGRKLTNAWSQHSWQKKILYSI